MAYSHKTRLTGALFYLLVLAACFWRDLTALMQLALKNEIHSHILLVPFISAYLIHVQRERLPKERAMSWLPGILVLLVAMIAVYIRHALSLSATDQLSLAALAIVLCVVAGGFLFQGASWMKSVAFPFFFLLFGVPLPDQMVDTLETWSKLGSAEVAAAFFSISGTPFYRDGVYFQIPGMMIEVAQECSGIRSSWVLFITSLLAAHMFLRRAWSRAVLVLFVIPLGLLRNGFRILVIGLLCANIGPEMIESPIHRRGGPIFFALSLVPLFFLLAYLRRREMPRIMAKA